MTVGVLAVQGDFEAHQKALHDIGVASCQVRTADDLPRDLSGFIFPGGESSTQRKLIQRYDLLPALQQVVDSKLPIFATCAGMILCAKIIEGREQKGYGWLEITVKRNGWGRQVFSFEGPADVPGTFGSQAEPLPMVFIRAPRIVEVGPQVEVLERFQGEPVMVRQGNVTAAAFHPELGTDRRIYRALFAAH